jgi:WD40 repeat protein
MDFSPDGSRLAIEGPELGMVSIFDTTSGELAASLCCHTALIRTIAFTPDGLMVATASEDGMAKIWDATSGNELFTLSGLMGPVEDLVFSPECAEPPQAPFTGCSRYIYTTSRDGAIKKWDISPAGDRDLLTAQGMIAGFTPDESQIEVYDLDPENQLKMQVWQIQPWGEAELVGVYAQPPLPARIVAGNTVTFPERTVTVIASEDGSVQTWQVGNPQEMTAYSVPIPSPATDEEGVIGVFILPQGLRMVTRYRPDSTQIWDVATGQLLLSLPAWGAVDLSPDGRLLAIGGEDGSVSLWDAASGERLRTIAAHTQPVGSLFFSPDSQRLATGSMDMFAKVWDLSTGAELLSLPHHTTVDRSIFSPDGARLAADQTDGSLYIWDVDPASPAFGQLSHRFTGLGDIPGFNGFSPTGKIVFMGGYFGHNVRLYVLPLEDLVPLVRSRLTRTFTPEECQLYRIQSCP